MNKFKKGDIVKIISNHNYNGANHEDQSDVGKIGKITQVFKTAIPTYAIDCTIYAFWESDLELAPEPTAEPKTLDNLEVGDVITNGPLDRVIIKIETLYTIQPINKIDTFSHTLEQLKEYGYKLIDPTKPTVKINDKEYILNEKLAKAIEEAEEL